jgi:HPt (histidine-containing phosphotransfer) domain-containing protein
MRLALSRQEYATFKELAHILKGSSGNVGAEALFAVCSEVLALGDSELRISAARLMNEALDSYPATRASLLRYLNGANHAIL